MSVLAILLPPHERTGGRAAADSNGGALRLPTEWPFVFSADGRGVSSSGAAAPALLPRADRVVLVLDAADVAWHRITVPKAPAARLRAALGGVLEDAVLDEDDVLHLALAAGSTPGQAGWVAATGRVRLAAALAALESTGLVVERVVAVQAPAAADSPGHGHFHLPPATLVDSPEAEGADSSFGADAGPQLELATADGALVVPMASGLARALLPPAETAMRWTATPAAAAAAERWLGAPVALLADAERTLEAATQAPTNLRQFELVARHRGLRAVRAWWQGFWSPEWRVVRWGVAALLALQLVGLNAYAWQQNQAIQAKRSAMEGVLKAAHPGVRVVLNAPLQMQTETDRLRAAAGRAGEADLEALLSAAAAAWPDGQGPAQTIGFEGARLALSAPGFGEPQLTQMRQRLEGSGYRAEFAEGRVVVGRAPPGARTEPGGPGGRSDPGGRLPGEPPPGAGPGPGPGPNGAPR